MPEEPGKLTIVAARGGTISEISQFLTDLENAYLALYAFSHSWPSRHLERRFPSKMWLELGYAFPLLGQPGLVPLQAESLPPSARLTLERVQIESPGFWEFLASVNPLRQIREFLNDRHRRRQDRDFREAAERERLELENELIRQQIADGENSILRERIAILRELGYSNNDIDRLIWSNIGVPLSHLGRHQDSELIRGAD